MDGNTFSQLATPCDEARRVVSVERFVKSTWSKVRDLFAIVCAFTHLPSVEILGCPLQVEYSALERRRDLRQAHTCTHTHARDTAMCKSVRIQPHPLQLEFVAMSLTSRVFNEGGNSAIPTERTHVHAQVD